MSFLFWIIACCAICWIFLRKNFAWYQMSLLMVYIAFLTVSGELGNTYPIYLLFAVVPYLFSKDRYGPFALLFIIVSIVYLAIGVGMQSANASLVTFLTRLFPFIFFLMLLNNTKAEDSLIHFKPLLIVALIVEAVIGFYLIRNGSGAGFSFGDQIRLVSNSQPITGNIGIAILPILGYLYFKNSTTFRDRLLLIGCLLFFFFWIVFSGTRGYILIYGACILPIVINFFFLQGGNRKTSSFAIVALMLILIVALIALVVFENDLTRLIESVFRSGAIGVRGFENTVVMQFFLSENLFEKFLGIGLGGTWSEHGSFFNILIQNAQGSYLLSEYAGATGTSFHNFYANILGLQGIAGIALIVGVYIKMIGATTTACSAGSARRGFKAFLIMYIIGYAAMLYFRWSADCGLCEMAMLAYVINLARSDSQENCDTDKESMLLGKKAD